MEKIMKMMMMMSNENIKKRKYCKVIKMRVIIVENII